MCRTLRGSILYHGIHLIYAGHFIVASIIQVVITGICHTSFHRRHVWSSTCNGNLHVRDMSRVTTRNGNLHMTWMVLFVNLSWLCYNVRTTSKCKHDVEYIKCKYMRVIEYNDVSLIYNTCGFVRRIHDISLNLQYMPWLCDCVYNVKRQP